MSADLDEIKERLKYCRTLIEQLRSEIDKWGDESIEFVQVPFPIGATANSPNYSIWARLKSPPTVQLRSQTGLIANELRSCLDALATVLAIRHSGNADKTYFPITESEQKFNSEGRKKMKLLSAEDQEAIRNFRPWNGGRQILYNFHILDIKRKHIKLQSAAAHGGLLIGKRNQMAIAGRNGFIAGGEIDGIPIGRITLVNSELSNDGSLSMIAKNIPRGIVTRAMPGLTFSEPAEMASWEVVPTLREIADIVEEFVGQFD